MRALHLAWVGWLALALGGVAAADDVEEIVRQLQPSRRGPSHADQRTDDVEEIVRQLQQDTHEIQAQAQKTIEARKQQTVQQLERIARELAAGGNEAGAARAKDAARQIGGKRLGGPAIDVAKRTEVLWGGTWYPATVLDRKDGKFFIKYDGYTDVWNEWVGPERIRFPGGVPEAIKAPRGAENPLPIKPAAGKAVQVEWGGRWWPASVIEQKEGKFLIHYDNHGDEWNEWIGADRIRAK